jgi:hypothetical protein
MSQISEAECILLEDLLRVNQKGKDIDTHYPEDIGERDDPIDHEYSKECVEWYDEYCKALKTLRLWRKDNG